jgi:hypothetical protein
MVPGLLSRCAADLRVRRDGEADEPRHPGQMLSSQGARRSCKNRTRVVVEVSLAESCSYASAFPYNANKRAHAFSAAGSL